MGSPILKKEMTIILQEKQQLLQQWVTNGENCEKIETSLKLTRCQEGELEKGRELLTISEMKSCGFSTSLGTSRTVLTHTPKILDQKYSKPPYKEFHFGFPRAFFQMTCTLCPLGWIPGRKSRTW